MYNRSLVQQNNLGASVFSPDVDFSEGVQIAGISDGHKVQQNYTHSIPQSTACRAAHDLRARHDICTGLLMNCLDTDEMTTCPAMHRTWLLTCPWQSMELVVHCAGAQAAWKAAVESELCTLSFAFKVTH